MEIDRKFLKKLWNDEKVMCPNCDKIYRTISILNNMLKNGK